MNDVPDEILVHILDYVIVPRFYANIYRYVCKRWNNLIPLHSSLEYTKKRFKLYDIGLTPFGREPPKKPSVRHLTLPEILSSGDVRRVKRAFYGIDPSDFCPPERGIPLSRVSVEFLEFVTGFTQRRASDIFEEKRLKRAILTSDIHVSKALEICGYNISDLIPEIIEVDRNDLLLVEYFCVARDDYVRSLPNVSGPSITGVDADDAGQHIDTRYDMILEDKRWVIKYEIINRIVGYDSVRCFERVYNTVCWMSKNHPLEHNKTSFRRWSMTSFGNP